MDPIELTQMERLRNQVQRLSTENASLKVKLAESERKECHCHHGSEPRRNSVCERLCGQRPVPTFDGTWWAR